MGINSNMANREVCDLIFYDYLTKKPFLNMDYANVSTTEVTGESVFAHGGKGHTKRVQFSGERGGTMTVETQMQSVGLWQLITGGETSKEARFVKRIQSTVLSDEITLTEKPVIGSINVYLAHDDCGTDLNCTVVDQVITLSDTLSDGTEVIVYYTLEVTDKVHRISIKSTSFPKTFSIYGDTIMKTEDDDILPYRIIAYKVAPQSNLSLSFSSSGDPGTITITLDLMSDENDNMLDLILIEE